MAAPAPGAAAAAAAVVTAAGQAAAALPRWGPAGGTQTLALLAPAAAAAGWCPPPCWRPPPAAAPPVQADRQCRLAHRQRRPLRAGPALAPANRNAAAAASPVPGRPPAHPAAAPAPTAAPLAEPCSKQHKREAAQVAVDCEQPLTRLLSWRASTRTACCRPLLLRAGCARVVSLGVLQEQQQQLQLVAALVCRDLLAPLLQQRDGGVQLL